MPYTVTWTASAGATRYLWETGYNDGSGYQTGTTTATTGALAMPYHISGQTSTAWGCVKAESAGGTSESACNGYTVPAKPIVPVAVAPTVVSAVCAIAMSTLAPDTTGGWTANFKMDGGIAIGSPISTPDASGRYIQTHPGVAAGSHTYYVDWTKGGTLVSSPKATVACP
jgi:hypothetical protein